ncbi:MAG: helix-turn-helix transcriptional regulator [Myxococcota bacterium]
MVTRHPRTSRSGGHEELERSLTLIPYLYENGRVPVDEVAARYNLSREEVVGAIDRLAVLGDDVLLPEQLIQAYIEEGFVGIDIEPAVKRPIRLTARQALALLVGAEFLRAEGHTVSPALERATEKVRQATSGGQREQLEELERVIGFEREAVSDLFRMVERARVERERLEIDYLAYAGDRIRTRRIDPYLLWNYGGAWYCAAWCHLRDATRTFRISRIREARPTGEHFEIDPSFDAGRYLKGPVYVPGRGDFAARIRFAPEIARFVEQRWADSAITREKDGAIVMTRWTSSEAWLVKWLLPYGPAAEILEPASARAAMAAACGRVLARYGETAENGGGSRA